LAALRAGLALDDEAALSRLAASLPCRFLDGQIRLGEEDVTDLIRAEEVGNTASKIAVLPALRQALAQLQHGFRVAPGLVADGRDMGTVIFPGAIVKVFLTASVEARADRRHKQLIGKGIPANIDDLLKDLRERDARDTNRAVAPLKPAEGAYLLETSDMSVDEAVQQVVQWYAKVQGSALQ
jgi:cytidylate kinase